MTSIRLFRTPPHACSYKEGEEAVTVFVDPELELAKPLNSALTEAGYRRSGAHIYRPACENCAACISCRVPVAEFSMGRRYRKIWKKNAAISVVEVQRLDEDECFPLYERYINLRHADGDMYPATRSQFDAFINTTAEGTVFFKFYEADRLVAVSVTDRLEQGLSAVYTFFDPGLQRQSLGIFAILWQIKQAQALDLPFVYLGYWIKDCQKMAYKTEFRPVEILSDGRWLRAS